MRVNQIAVVASLLFATQVHAQVATGGATVVVKATGEVTHANDEATLMFSADESGRDKAAVASLVNKKMKQGTEIVRNQDDSAKLKTENYTTIALYKETKGSFDSGQREVIGWRVMQSLQVTTNNLAGLPKLAAAAQGALGLNSINFHLSDTVHRKLDEQRIVATYQNLNERIASIAGAMGRKVSDATLEMADFEGASNTIGQQTVTVSGRRNRSDATQVAEPSFEPGETTLQMQLVGKVKFK
jgi:predicted secreted protein